MSRLQINPKTLKGNIETKVAYYANLLGISDYKFDISMVNPSKMRTQDKIVGAYATVYVDEETRIVDIVFNKKLLKEQPEEIDRTIIHELLHVRFNELSEFVLFLIKTYVKDTKARKTYRNQIDLLAHKNIVALADMVGKKWQT